LALVFIFDILDIVNEKLFLDLISPFDLLGESIVAAITAMLLMMMMMLM
jgi:hypothetical protein